MPIGFRTSRSLKLTSIYRNTFTYSNTTTITVPSNVNNGYLGVIFNIASSFSGSISYVEPTGWTNIYNRSWTTTGVARATAFVKILDDTDASSVLTLMNGGLSEYITLWTFKANAPITSFTPFSLDHVWTNSNPGAQTMEVDGTTTPIMAFVDYSSSGNVSAVETPNFGGLAANSEVRDHNNTTAVRNGYKIWNIGTTPVTTTADMNDTGNANRTDVFCLEVR